MISQIKKETKNYSVIFFCEYYNRNSAFAKKDPSITARVIVKFNNMGVRDRYLSDIYVDSWKKLDPETFKLERPITCTMQTTSYGAIGGEELNKFMEDIKESMEVIKMIENFDWSEFKNLLK